MGKKKKNKKDQIQQPNWNEAPEGTTHWGPETTDYWACWYNLNTYEYWSVKHHTSWHTFYEEDLEEHRKAELVQNPNVVNLRDMLVERLADAGLGIELVKEEATEPPANNSGGGDVNYYLAKITHPKRLMPTEVECEDIIRALNMTFDEGEAFKAIWRNAAMRLFEGKPGDSAIRNGEKVRHYGQGMILDAQIRADAVA